jgi:hypothetical protein
MDIASLLNPVDPATNMPNKSSLYKPLDETKQDIRILTLHAAKTGDAEEVIRCTLEHTTLATAGPYTALSYCWGFPGETKDVDLNGITTPGRLNLWHFLQSIRTIRGTTRVWVDYLCINQNDHQERNHQVRLMSDIYSGTAEAITWLGLADSSSIIAFEALRTGVPKRKDRKTPISRSNATRARRAIRALLERPY